MGRKLYVLWLTNKIILCSSCLLLHYIAVRDNLLTYYMLCRVMMNKYLSFISKGRDNHV